MYRWFVVATRCTDRNYVVCSICIMYRRSEQYDAANALLFKSDTCRSNCWTSFLFEKSDKHRCYHEAVHWLLFQLTLIAWGTGPGRIDRASWNRRSNGPWVAGRAASILIGGTCSLTRAETLAIEQADGQLRGIPGNCAQSSQHLIVAEVIAIVPSYFEVLRFQARSTQLFVIFNILTILRRWYSAQLGSGLSRV